jgi:hypothetical protein
MAALEEAAPNNIVPDPPFTEDSPWGPGGSEGHIPCFFPGCQRTYRDYSALAGHIKNPTHGHQTNLSAFKGTFFYAQFSDENNKKYRARYAQKQQKEEEEGGDEPLQKKPKAARTLPEESKGDSSASVAAGQTQWLAMMCWVKCDKDGTPISPLECAGPCATTTMPGTPLPDSTPVGTSGGQTTLVVKRGLHPTLLAPRQEAGGPHVGSLAIEEVVPGPMDMLTDMWRQQKTQQAKDEKDRTWQHDLPEVLVKPSYLSHAGGPAKGEIVKGKPCKRADWPPEFSADSVQVDDFQKWMVTEKLYNPDWAKARGRDVGRVLGALDCRDNNPWSTECMVAFGLGDVYRQLFAMPLMAGKYSWALDSIDSLLVYLDYHQDLLQQKIKNEVEGPWEKHRTIISGMEAKLKGGIRKSCVMQCNKKLRAKAKEDEKAIANMHSPAELHAAVADAYKCVIKIHAQYADLESMPPLVRAKATACLAGAIALDTYQGRQMEWSLLEHEYMVKVLQGIQEYLECEEHKTAKFYGDVYKWLSSSLKKAMILYSELPKRPGCTKFLVPAFEGVERVCLSHYLKMFCSFFLSKDKTYPTCNLLRKWFHTAMMKKANNPENIKKLMMQIDPHGDAVMDKHYILKSPQDHVDIAKAVYHEIMGEVTAWPTEEEAHDYDLEKLLEEVMEEDFQEDQNFHEDGEYEEEGWEWGPLFGFSSVAPEALAIADGQADEGLAASSSGVVERLSPDMPLVAAESQSAGGCNQAGGANDDKAALAATKRAKHDKHFSPQYWEPPAVSGLTRSQPLGPVESDWIMDQLAKWQDTYAGGDRTKKFEGKGSTEFYQDMRCDGIDAGVLSKWHSQAICSSHIKSKLKFGHLAVSADIK